MKKLLLTLTLATSALSPALADTPNLTEAQEAGAAMAAIDLCPNLNKLIKEDPLVSFGIKALMLPFKDTEGYRQGYQLATATNTVMHDEMCENAYNEFAASFLADARPADAKPANAKPADATTTNSTDPIVIEVTDWQYHHEPFNEIIGNNLTISVKVTNNTDQPYDGMMITCTTFDAAENTVGEGSDFLPLINPGKSTTISLDVLNLPAEPATYSCAVS